MLRAVVGHHDNSSCAVWVVHLDLVDNLAKRFISVLRICDVEPEVRWADGFDAPCGIAKWVSALWSGGLVVVKANIGSTLVGPNTDIAKITDHP